MAMVVSDLEGTVLIDYMPHKTTITGDACAPVLWNLKKANKKK
jgi:hypothetical protein